MPKTFKTYSENINVRTTHSLKRELMKEAKNKGVSLTEIVNKKLSK